MEKDIIVEENHQSVETTKIAEAPVKGAVRINEEEFNNSWRHNRMYRDPWKESEQMENPWPYHDKLVSDNLNTVRSNDRLNLQKRKFGAILSLMFRNFALPLSFFTLVTPFFMMGVVSGPVWIATVCIGAAVTSVATTASYFKGYSRWFSDPLGKFQERVLDKAMDKVSNLVPQKTRQFLNQYVVRYLKIEYIIFCLSVPFLVYNITKKRRQEFIKENKTRPQTIKHYMLIIEGVLTGLVAVFSCASLFSIGIPLLRNMEQMRRVTNYMQKWFGDVAETDDPIKVATGTTDFVKNLENIKPEEISITPDNIIIDVALVDPLSDADLELTKIKYRRLPQVKSIIARGSLNDWVTLYQKHEVIDESFLCSYISRGRLVGIIHNGRFVDVTSEPGEFNKKTHTYYCLVNEDVKQAPLFPDMHSCILTTKRDLGSPITMCSFTLYKTEQAHAATYGYVKIPDLKAQSFASKTASGIYLAILFVGVLVLLVYISSKLMNAWEKKFHAEVASDDITYTLKHDHFNTSKGKIASKGDIITLTGKSNVEKMAGLDIIMRDCTKESDFVNRAYYGRLYENLVDPQIPKFNSTEETYTGEGTGKKGAHRIENHKHGKDSDAKEKNKHKDKKSSQSQPRERGQYVPKLDIVSVGYKNVVDLLESIFGGDKVKDTGISYYFAKIQNKAFEKYGVDFNDPYNKYHVPSEELIKRMNDCKLPMSERERLIFCDRTIHDIEAMCKTLEISKPEKVYGFSWEAYNPEDAPFNTLEYLDGVYTFFSDDNKIGYAYCAAGECIALNHVVHNGQFDIHRIRSGVDRPVIKDITIDIFDQKAKVLYEDKSVDDKMVKLHGSVVGHAKSLPYMVKLDKTQVYACKVLTGTGEVASGKLAYDANLKHFVHTCSTLSGFSGSPVFICKNGKWYVAGSHFGVYDKRNNGNGVMLPLPDNLGSNSS
jgi:hypothetical protein